ncbi:UDP-N-acetylmuramoyl-tripeptide--D-alanyl-D-alanine ligase [bioreactor metagenome]|uniref:UDP-MurNAc-pentapeptide synthetase n=1 Tax=bioreactor metagenome TaxID=1076179 RepID=A0A644T1C4_9ZZZZ|nr:UDP-N-acetylmuramoyl-tripeptide--D-alanyl-D-alanine ligase [Negativicutes bacterium]
MAEFILSEVCTVTKGVLLQPGTIKQFSGVTTDTRKVRPGDLFIALQGERFDGHDFIPQAIQNGAVGIVISREENLSFDDNVAIIKVGNTLSALQNLARFHRQRFAIPVIAVTGSNGKTTTKDMIAAVLGSRFTILKTEANYNNEIGLPLTLLDLNLHHDVAIVEMGMRGLGQIKELTDIALPSIGVITNVGETHMELLGSLENIATAKAELVESLPKAGRAILNGDNAFVREMGQKTDASVIFYGIADGCDVQGVNVKINENSMTISAKYLGEIAELFVPTVGRHNVYNVLAAVAVGLVLGLSFDEIRQGIRHFTGSAMRLSFETKGNYTIINDAYNASPLSMEAAVDTLAEIAKGRKVVVLGDMLELGQVAVEAHQRIGRKVGNSGIEVVITVGEMAAYIAQEARVSGSNVVIACKNHEEAENALKQHLMPGDTVLLKGSRGMQMEKLLDAVS